MNKKIKDILWGLMAVALVVVCGVWFLGDDLEHIRDTNGPDDDSLTTITDENIINMDIGAMGLEKTTGILSGNSIEFHSDKFTGVEEILYTNYWGKSDFDLSLTNLVVTGGNFKMVVVHNDEIVAVLEPDLFVDYRLEDIVGTVSLRIAGESAAFRFSISLSEYDEFAHG